MAERAGAACVQQCVSLSPFSINTPSLPPSLPHPLRHISQENELNEKRRERSRSHRHATRPTLEDST